MRDPFRFVDTHSISRAPGRGSRSVGGLGVDPVSQVGQGKGKQDLD